MAPHYPIARFSQTTHLEFALFRVLDSLNLGIILFDPNGKRLYENRSAKEILGDSSRASRLELNNWESVSQRLLDVEKARPIKKERFSFSQALRGKLTAPCEFLVRRGEQGKLKRTAASASPLSHHRSQGHSRSVVLFLEPLDHPYKTSREKHPPGQEFTANRIKKLKSTFLKRKHRERHDIAVTLHDEIGQYLSILQLEFSSIKAQLRNANPVLEARLIRISELLRKLVKKTGRLSKNFLRSHALSEGLSSVIRRELEELKNNASIQIQSEISSLSSDLSKTNQLLILRIFQESISNALKHSQAKKIWVTLKQAPPKSLFLKVKDDGVGFTRSAFKSPHSKGIQGIKQKAKNLKAKLTIKSRIGNGTEIEIIVPEALSKGS